MKRLFEAATGVWCARTCPPTQPYTYRFIHTGTPAASVFKSEGSRRTFIPCGKERQAYCAFFYDMGGMEGHARTRKLYVTLMHTSARARVRVCTAVRVEFVLWALDAARREG